ncbi:mercuric transport protein MerTP [Pontibacter aquaedesilientis]|uniref:mercuric transport protein MerTP n=1 Tax=Pontibacter aquaedesilientis TaxID=2766980 RepID=UPI001CD07B9B|nr:mercuric transport protein MerTP [Pontibacter aquaedesilientis]
MKTDHKLIGLGIFGAVAASTCCIVPLMALLAGTSGLISSFSFLEPYRYIFMSVTVLVLGLAWYQQLSPVIQTDCDCETEKPRFYQGKTFLFMVTLFAAVMLSFPSFSYVFYRTPQHATQNQVSDLNTAKTVEFSISGMTCSGCEAHVEQEVFALDGILKAKASYDDSNTVVEYDSTKATVFSIKRAILKTGYEVTEFKER